MTGRRWFLLLAGLLATGLAAAAFAATLAASTAGGEAEDSVRLLIVLHGVLLWLLCLALGGAVYWALRPARRGAGAAAAGRSAILLAVLGLPAAAPFPFPPPEAWLVLVPVLLACGIVLLRGAPRWTVVVLAAALALSLVRDVLLLAGLLQDPELLWHLLTALTFTAGVSVKTVLHIFLGVLIDAVLLLLLARLVLTTAALFVAAGLIKTKEPATRLS